MIYKIHINVIQYINYWLILEHLDYGGDHCENLITDPCITGAAECKNNASCHARGNNEFECLCRTDSPYSGI